MKSLISLIVLAALTAGLSGQGAKRHFPSSSDLNPLRGYVNIPELGGGPGLAVTSVPYSKYYFGLTTVNGYQINQYLIAGAGLGFHLYNEGWLLPLYASGRFTYPIHGSKISPYANGDAGILISFGNSGDDNRLFVNPVLGARYTISPVMAADLGIGIFTQKLPGAKRDSFLNFRAGIVFIPKR